MTAFLYGSPPFTRVYRVETVASMLAATFVSAASAAAPDRVRSFQEMDAITGRYTRQDKFERKSDVEKLTALRAVRKKLAEEFRTTEGMIKLPQIAKHLGVRERDVKAYWWTMAGDFTGGVK